MGQDLKPKLINKRLKDSAIEAQYEDKLLTLRYGSGLHRLI